MNIEDKIWIGRDGQKFGPYTEASIRQWLSQGQLTPETPAWCKGMTTWGRLSDIVADSTVPPPVVVPPPPVEHVRVNNPANGAPYPSSGADYGMFLLAIPVIAVCLTWFWIGSMNLLESPDSKLNLIIFATVIGTAFLAAIEAQKIGMKYDRKNKTHSPTQWFFSLLLLWIVGYPVYLYERKRYGLKNLLFWGIVVAIAFCVSSYLMSASIEETRRHIFGG